MSATRIISREEDCALDTMQLIPEKPVAVCRNASVAGPNQNDLLIGIVGMIAMGAILGLSIYFIVRYLL